MTRTRIVQRHRRASVRVDARISTLDPVRDPASGERYFRISEETCANLSQGGAFVATHQPIPEGCRVMVEFDLPDAESVQALGRVVWSRTRLTTPGSASRGPVSGIGIAFTEATPQHIDRLESYLAKLLPRKRAAKPSLHTTLPGSGA